MNNDPLSERLKHARKISGLKQEDVSELAQMKQSTYSKLERGVQKSATNIATIASVLNVNAIWLENGTGPMLISDKPVYSSSHPSNEDDVMLYQYADPRCVHGPNTGNSEKPEKKAISVSAAVLADLKMKESDAIGYLQNDDSMAMAINKGDEGIIDSSQKSPETHSGRVFAIANGENVLIRRIVYQATGRFNLTCDNSNKTLYPDETIPANATADLNIIGRLRWSGGEK